jgi:hypothetical protein
LGASRLRFLPQRDVEVTRFVADATLMRDAPGIEPPQDPLAKLPLMMADGKK